RDAGGEIAMARREYPHVDAPRLVAADALERALLQHSEQLDLHVGAHVPDLVEEQRAAVGGLEAADSTRDRPRERALLVTEELALEKLLRNRRAIDRHERPVAAVRQLVDSARGELLTGARFALDQHRAVVAGDLLYQLVKLCDCA